MGKMQARLQAVYVGAYFEDRLPADALNRRRMLMLKQTMWLFMLACCAPVYAGGAIYKWVDEQGNAHYVDTPPPQGSDYQIIHKPPAPGQNPAAARTELKKKVESVDQPREAQQQRKQEVDVEARRTESCQQAKKNLEILAKNPHPIRTEADGREIVLNEEQRQEEAQKNQQLVEKYCQKP